MRIERRGAMPRTQKKAKKKRKVVNRRKAKVEFTGPSPNMKLPEVPQRRRQLHQSGVNMFQRCGMQFGFRYVQGIRRPPSAFMVCGRATDAGVNWDLDTKILTEQLANITEITDLVAETVDKDERADSIKLDPEDIEEKKSVKQVIAETKERAIRLATLHHSEIAPGIRPWRTARKFSINLDPFLLSRAKLLREESDMPDLSPWRRGVMTRTAEALEAVAKDGMDFVGEQDIVEKFINDPGNIPEGMLAMEPEILNIRDTKTSGKRKNQEQVDNDDQLTAYATGSLVIDGRLPDDLIFDVIVETEKRKKQTVQTISTKRKEIDVDIYLNRVANTVAAYQMGVFAPTNQSNWWCSSKYCGYANICPYFRQTDRPGNPIAELGENAGKSDDLLPILQKSVALAKVAKGEDESE